MDQWSGDTGVAVAGGNKTAAGDEQLGKRGGERERSNTALPVKVLNNRGYSIEERV